MGEGELDHPPVERLDTSACRPVRLASNALRGRAMNDFPSSVERQPTVRRIWEVFLEEFSAASAGRVWQSWTLTL